ncbi:hypothetical protein AAMO2058_001744800, partial [Amorphochlora amoebiformis]
EDGVSMKATLEEMGHYEFRELHIRPTMRALYRHAQSEYEEFMVNTFNQAAPLIPSSTSREAEAHIVMAEDAARLVMTNRESTLTPPLPRAQLLSPPLLKMLSASLVEGKRGGRGGGSGAWLGGGGLGHARDSVRVSAAYVLVRASSSTPQVITRLADPILATIGPYVTTAREPPPKELQSVLALGGFFIRHSQGEILPLLAQNACSTLQRVLSSLGKGASQNVANSQEYVYLARTFEGLSYLLKEPPQAPRESGLSIVRNILAISATASEVVPEGEEECRCQIVRLFQVGIGWVGPDIIGFLPTLVRMACERADWRELSLLFPVLSRILSTLPTAAEGMRDLLDSTLHELIRRVSHALPMECEAYRQDRVDLLVSWLRFLHTLISAGFSKLLLTGPRLAMLRPVLSCALLGLRTSKTTKKAAISFLSRLHAEWLGFGIESANFAELMEIPGASQAMEFVESFFNELDPNQRRAITKS